MEKTTPVNHVFVDFENVSTVDAAVIDAPSVSFTLLVGAKQKKLNLEVVESMLANANTVQLVRLKKSGPNALDFTLAYTLGRTTATHPSDHFFIISKDTGFDPLVEHLRSKNIRVERHENFESLPFVDPKPVAKKNVIKPSVAKERKPASAPSTTPLSELAEKVLQMLMKSSQNRPQTEKRLLTHILSHLAKDATDKDAEAVVRELEDAGRLAFDAKRRPDYKL